MGDRFTTEYSEEDGVFIKDNWSGEKHFIISKPKTVRLLNALHQDHQRVRKALFVKDEVIRQLRWKLEKANETIDALTELSEEEANDVCDYLQAYHNGDVKEITRMSPRRYNVYSDSYSADIVDEETGKNYNQFVDFDDICDVLNKQHEKIKELQCNLESRSQDDYIEYLKSEIEQLKQNDKRPSVSTENCEIFGVKDVWNLRFEGD